MRGELARLHRADVEVFGGAKPIHADATASEAARTLAAGHFPSQAEALRLCRSIATMNASSAIPPLSDQTPTWSKAADLARRWGLNHLADRLAQRAARSAR
jgi:hypothetical protein